MTCRFQSLKVICAGRSVSYKKPRASRCSFATQTYCVESQCTYAVSSSRRINRPFVVLTRHPPLQLEVLYQLRVSWTREPRGFGGKDCGNYGR